jgi:hypothetical protein
MQLSADAREAIKTEAQRFAQDLSLSDDQKTRLKTALENAREKIEDYRQSHPDVSKMDLLAKVRDARVPLRAMLTGFLTPDQLTKWDAEVTKAKSFLGIASS